MSTDLRIQSYIPIILNEHSDGKIDMKIGFLI